MPKGLNIEFQAGFESHHNQLLSHATPKHIGWIASKKLREAGKPSTWGTATSISVAFLFVIGITLLASDIMSRFEWYGKTQNAWWAKSMFIEDSIFENVTNNRGYRDNYLAKPIILSLKNVWEHTFGMSVAQASVLENEKWYARRNAQSHTTINIDPGRAFTVETTFTNSGTYTWYNSGQSYVSLVSKRNSEMRHDFWFSSIEPAVLKERTVSPESVGSFRFALQAPGKAGVYTETFTLYAGNTKIEGDGITITLHVGGATPPPLAPKREENPNELQKSIINGSADDDDTPIESDSTGQTPEQETTNPENDGNIPEGEGNETLYEGDVFAEEGISTTTAQITYEEPTLFVQDIWMNEPEIRVGLYEMNDYVIMTSLEDYRIIPSDSQQGVDIPGGTKTFIAYDEASKKHYAIAGRSSVYADHIRFVPGKSDGVFMISNYHNPVTWNPSLNDNTFRGVIEIVSTDEKDATWVINELPMETYLKGLTETSEVSPLEYHKSIATAARSYAIWQLKDGTRHRGKPFDVDAKIDQVYRGYNSELRLPTFVQAVEETEGVVVTYEDEIALTPYFAQSDGRTRSYNEVWGGPDQPHLKSVPDTTNTGLRLFGHGVGMSARGALIQASRFGKSFDEILHHYYTDVELKQIYNDGETSKSQE